MWKNRILCLICVCVCVFKLLKLLLFQKRIVLLSSFIFLMRAQGPPIPTATHICSSSSSFYLLLPLFPTSSSHLPLCFKALFCKSHKITPKSFNKQPKIPMAPYLNFRSKLVRKRSMKEGRYIQFFLGRIKCWSRFFFFFFLRR